jgi:hypothetical protein
MFRQSSLLNLGGWGCAACLAADMAKICIGVSGVRVMAEYGFQASLSANLRSPYVGPHQLESPLAGTAR